MQQCIQLTGTNCSIGLIVLMINVRDTKRETIIKDLMLAISFAGPVA